MTTSIMNTAQSGLQAAQAGLLVTSQNIAGASVDGFSRRNATAIVSGMAPNSSILMGTSFSVEGFTRYYSQLLETQRRAQQSKTSYSETLVNSTEMLDALMADQSNSLAVAYSEFFNAAGNLVTDPESIAHRSSLASRAGVLVQRLLGIADTLRVIEEDSTIALKSTLQSANDLSAGLARVNIKILEGNSPGHFTPSADYLDERDRLLMQLQRLVGGQSLINSDGTASHYAQGIPLVDRGQVARFQPSEISITDNFVPEKKNFVPIKFENGTTTKLSLRSFEGGEAGGYVTLLGNFLPDLSRRLDTLAIATVASVNNMETATGASFNIFKFKTISGDETAPSYKYWDIATSSWVTVPITISSADDIASLLDKLDPLSGSYDQDVADGLEDLKVANLSLADIDLQGIDSTWAASMEGSRPFFVQPISDLVGTVGTQIASWVSENNSNQSLTQVLNDRRESVAGVNLDEEAANMVKFQQLYAASSKLIQTGNQMFETLLAMMA